MSESLHLGKYYRYLWEDAGLLVVIGYFKEVSVGKGLYEERYHVKRPSDEEERTLEQIMAAAALAAVSLAERESWGWTITLPGSATGFFCGVEPEGMVCGSVHPADPGKGAVHVQRQKGDEPMTQSAYEPLSDDPVSTLEQYFDQVAQIETRMVQGGTDVGLLVQALPNGRFEEVRELPDEKLSELFLQMAGRGELKPVGEVVMFYECRCSDEMILNMVTALSESSKKDIWEGKEQLEISCPRCSREFVLAKMLV